MPLLMFGRKGKVRRVPDGQFEKRRCPECGKTTVFRECLVRKTYTAYHFVDLWSSESTQFACDACGSVMDLDETEAPELSAREAQQREQLQAKQAAIEAKREHLRRQREVQQHEDAIEDELAAMKQRLGLAHDE
ncbi:MAG: hypothetical protein AB1Z98_34450 [Nannocystaceae bacterium]